MSITGYLRRLLYTTIRGNREKTVPHNKLPSGVESISRNAFRFRTNINGTVVKKEILNFQCRKLVFSTVLESTRQM